MMPDHAYWLLPWVDAGVGIIISSRHILAIVRNPEQFGETLDTCQATFKKHGEQMQSNMEGVARTEIIERVLFRGLVRIRNNRKKHSQDWHIQAFRLTRSMHLVLWRWAIYISKQPGRDRFCNVLINEIGRSNSRISTSLDIIASGQFVNDFVKGQEGVSIRMYSEDEVSLLPQWNDYAGLIDRGALSDEVLKEIAVDRGRNENDGK